MTNKSEEWPPNKPRCFTNVTFVHHKDKVKSRNEICAIATVKTKGSFNTLPRESSRPRTFSLRERMKHQSLQLAEEYLKQNSMMFKDISSIFKFVDPSCNMLIEGPCGIGKTYMCKEMAYQWSQGQLLTEKKLLFLVFLYKQSVHSLNSVKDLVRYSCQMEDDETIKIVANYLQNTDGEFLALFLDGFDEISESLPHDHLISRIIRHSILSKSIVVITSCSIACGSLCNLVEHRIEILGFTVKDRLRYISEALKDSPSEIIKLKQYLDDHPTVSSLCYIPLNMSIFLYLFKQNDLPHSHAELYKKFVELTVGCYIKKSQQSYENLKTTILNLARFSYVMLQKDQVVFNLAEISKTCPEIDFQAPGAMCGFGILHATEHFTTKGPEKTYSLNFVNSAVQEYLAALYIVSLPDHKQTELLKDTFWNEKYLNTWIMYVGLTKGRTIAFKSFLADKQFILPYRNSDPVQISSQIMRDKLKCLHLFQCFMEAKNQDMCKKVGESLQNKKIDLSGEVLLPNHVNTLAFFLTHSHQYSLGWDKLDLSRSSMQDVGCLLLLRELNSCNVKMHIRIINLSYNQLTKSSAGLLAELVQKCNAEEIDITGNLLEDNGAKYFSCCLKGNANLKSLIMNDNNITSNMADEIESEMSTTTSLQVIGITSQHLYVRNEYGSRITEVLKCYSVLTKFSMSNCSVTASEMMKILALLAKNINLNTLHLLHNDLGSKIEVKALATELSSLKHLSNFTLVEPGMMDIAADELISALYLTADSKVFVLSNPKLQAVQTSYAEISHMLLSNSSIVLLEIPKCFPENEQSVDLLVAAIKGSPLLQKIDISENKFNLPAVQKFADALKSVAILKSLIMKNIGIDENVAKALAYSLKDKSTLEHLDLNVNRIGSAGAIEISQALKNNIVLQVLNLHNNGIDSSAAEVISSMMINKIRLAELNISQNNLKSEGIIKIAKALQSVDTLKVLDLSSNKITSEASIHVASALRNNPYLQVLNVSHNDLQSSGCINLCKAIRDRHLSLEALDISHNKINSEAAHEIGHALKNKYRLKVLKISMNNFDTKISTIIASLKSCKRLMKLIFNNSGILNYAAAENICQIIYSNPWLEVLNISTTRLQPAGATRIFKALTNSRTLQILDVSHNEIDDTTTEQLIRSLCKSVKLRELKIQSNPLSSKVSEHIVCTMCESIKTLANIWVPHISDDDIRTRISDNIAMINKSREENNQLKWFSD